MRGRLLIVSTPIGNLKDITERAREALAEADVVVAEDTRRTSVLLNHLGIKKPMISYYKHVEKDKLSRVMEAIRGKVAALVSDAGTPLVCDPGFLLVKAAIEEGFEVVPVPGPSSILAALVASGIEPCPFSFHGYIPKKGRAEFFRSLRGRRETLVFFETALRLPDSLRAMLEELGDRRCCIARELTKVHEEFIRGRISEVLPASEGLRGEICLVVEGAGEEVEPWRERALRLVDAGYSVREAARIVALLFGVSKREVYGYLNEVCG